MTFPVCGIPAVEISPVYAASATSVNAVGSTSLSADLPADISSGDLLLLYNAYNGAQTGVPSGWTEITGSDDGKNQCFYKVASGAEGATVAWTGGASTQITSVAVRITGISGSPIDVSDWGTYAAGADTTIVAPSIAATTGAGLLVQFFSNISAASATWTEDNGMTERVDQIFAGLSWSSAAATKTLTASGATGNTTGTMSAGASARNALSIIVKP